MKTLKKICVIVCSVILCLAMLWQTVSAAVTGPETLYVKDLKIIYADNADEAKKQLPDGYSLVDGNINSGTGELGVFICYSTTKNRDEAITDIKVMHESGGFQRTDFKSSLDEAIDGIYGLAQEMMTAINEFIQNYNAGLPAAVYAKEALDYFEYDENVLLGNFILSGKGTYKDYGKMILMCHEEILNPILSLIALGVQHKAGENWIDKLANVDPTSYGSSYDVQYRDRATKLRPVLQQFNDMYCYVLGYYDETYTYEDLTAENDKELFKQMAENKDLFLVIQEILQSYTVGITDTETNGDWTVEDMFAVGLNNTLNLYESYALLECLTPGQEIMLRLTGPYNFIIGSQNTEEVVAEARKTLLANIDTTEKIPIWEGINLDIFEKEVGLTSDAQRSIAAGKQYDIFAKDLDTLAQKYRDTASLISSCFTIASCSVLVAKCSLVLAPKFFNLISCYSIASAISAFASSAIVTTILTVLGITFTVVTIVCAIFITFFLEDIIAWMISEDYERTTIPEYMVDEVVGRDGISTYAYYRRVDNVRTDNQLGLDTDDNESGSDINVNEGYRWMALYTSDKSSVGNPIKADFLVETETGTEKDGYAPLSMFGNVIAVNLNSYADKNSSEYPAVYLHYVQDRLTPVESEKIYISDIIVESGKHEDEAKKKITDRGFIPLNHDFGCRDGESTYIGYTLTANANDAVKDIRLMYNLNGSSVTFGELDYAAAGTIGNFSLMISSGAGNPAPPIVGLELYERNVLPEDSLGYEPVNEFSGGMAHPLGRNEYRLYFVPETTFTTGPDYIAGIKSDVYYYNTFTSYVGTRHPHLYYDETDMFENSIDNYRKYKTQTYREQFFDFNSQTYFYLAARNSSDSNNYVNLSYKYTTTKNPYRAIYGVTANKSNGLTRFADSVSYAQVGYVLAAAELSYNSRFYTGVAFPYSAENNTSEFGAYVSDYDTYSNSSIFHYNAKYSPGKADAWFQDLNVTERTPVHAEDYVFNQDITQVFYNDTMNGLYLAGYQENRTPLTLDDILLSEKPLREEDVPSNFTPVTYMIGDSAEAANIVPSSEVSKIGTRSTYGGFSSEDITAVLYGEVYMYFRNEKTVNKQTVAQSSLKEGKYISALYLASRKEIRNNYNKTSKTGEQIQCSNISKATVENALFGKGATTTYRIHINSNFSKDDDFKNANYTYVGIQRSDNPNDAIRDIRLYVAQKGEIPEKETKRNITYNGKTFDVIYSLVGRASLTEQGIKSAADCAKERQVYVYVSSNPALGEPITEIKMDTVFSYDDFEPVLTMDNKHLLSLAKDSNNAIFTDSDYFLYGNHLSFKREGADKPYIQELELVGEDDSKSSVIKLLESGYTDIINKDMNEGTTKEGKAVYIGMKRTADPNDAVYDVIATNDQGKNPKETWNQFTLVEKIDLNANTWFGSYIYLYQSKTKVLNGSPLTDLKAVDENYQIASSNISNSGSEYTSAGDIIYKEDFVVNQDAEKQDFNEGAGGDWIHLVMCKEIKYESTLAYLGSMLGTGSWVTIGIFLFAAMSVGGFILIRKKRATVKTDETINEETEEI